MNHPPRELVQPSAHADALRLQIEKSLAAVVEATEPEELYGPVRYVMEGQGKRLRPLLVLLSGELCGVDVEEAMPAAAAVEVFHNFTLVHDDIMDHAAERRGRPTVHVRWDESTAILAGDYLLGLSFDLLARLRRGDVSAIIRAFHRMVGRLCEGQMLDKVFEQRVDVSVDDYLAMISAKTGALIETCLELGGLIADGDAERLDVLRTLGRHLGRAFQIQDDLLDLTADDERWGKAVGGDLVEGKKTFLLLRAIETATGEERDWFHRIIRDGGLPPDRVGEARDRMERLGVLAEARRAVDAQSDAALAQIGQLPEGPPARTLASLVERMRSRVH